MRSANGIDEWRIDSEPTLKGNPRDYPEEMWGIEDPRITYVPELDQYAVAYTSFALGGPGVSLALTGDFRSYERLGVIMPPEDKDAALLARRINGYWPMIHRPVTSLGAHMWISFSPDLRHWGSHKIILDARVVAGGKQIRLAYAPRRLRRRREGSQSITESAIQPRDASIVWAWRSLISTVRMSACSEETRGCLVLKHRTSAAEMSATLYFRVDRPSGQTEIPSTCTTVRGIPVWP